MNNHDNTLQNRAWGRIFKQITAFQAKMREHEINSVTADFNCEMYDDGAPIFESQAHQGNRGWTRIRKQADNRRLAKVNFVPFPERLEISGPNDRKIDRMATPTHMYDPSMLRAAAIIFANVFDYVILAQDANEQPCEFDLKLGSQGDIDIGIMSGNESRRQWRAPEQIHAYPELADWLESEIYQLGKNLTERFKTVLEDFVAEVNRDYPSLDLVIDVHDGEFIASVNEGEGRTNTNFMVLHALEQVNPVFRSRLEGFMNAYRDLGGKIDIDHGQPMVPFGIDKSARIHVGPEQEPAPSTVSTECGDEPGL